MQAFLEGAVLFALLWWFSRRPRPRYAVAGLFGLAYGLFRIFAEFFREPDAQFGFIAFGWLTMGMVLSLPLVLGGTGLVVWAATRKVSALRG
ncbi:MAG: hypothetical protein B7Z15_21515 [Rhizobiales bacterium 32-66-8]|nr:MAG: hypothetical protein B7Z15_21515 [Rhizobiales bacterium 32-66-8]